MADQAEFHSDREANFGAGIRAWPELADVIADGRRVGPIRVLTNWHGYFREAAGPGWVLVGDAGHFKDPTPGQGIGDALRQTDRLAPAIADGLGNSCPDAAMLRWWQWREDDAYEMHWFASDMGVPGVSSPLTTRLMRDVADDPEATRMFFGVLNHEVRPSQLFTPPRAVRATARALRDRPDRLIPTFKEFFSLGMQNARRTRRSARSCRADLCLCRKTIGQTTGLVKSRRRAAPAGPPQPGPRQQRSVCVRAGPRRLVQRST